MHTSRHADIHKGPLTSHCRMACIPYTGIPVATLLHQPPRSISLSLRLVTMHRLLVTFMLRIHCRAVPRHCRVLGKLLLNIILKGWQGSLCPTVPLIHPTICTPSIRNCLAQCRMRPENFPPRSHMSIRGIYPTNKNLHLMILTYQNRQPNAGGATAKASAALLRIRSRP